MATRGRTVVAALTVILPAVLLIVALLATAHRRVASSAAQSAALTDPLPVNAETVAGQLPNGLRYYVRRHGSPPKRAELRLVVNAGSLLEEDDQLGLAHFVEHMAFNGTKHFPGQEITAFMQSIGMRFGPSVNAYTNFDETVYMLQVPTDRPEVLDRAFLVLEDWARNVSFDPVEIDRERGVIIEEWRLRRGAAARIRDQQFPILLQGARHAGRLPIGKVEIIRSFQPERLTRFYADWYRPDLMAVIAVGDFDEAAVERLVWQHFEPIPARPSPPPRSEYDVPDHPGTRYAIVTDTEAPGTTVSVYNKLPLRNQSTVGAYRQGIVERLFSGMLSARLGELARQPDPPFLAATAGRGRFVRTKEASTLTARVREDGIERGLGALFAEAERVRRFGFTASELEREKTSRLRGLERAVAERGNLVSGVLAAELIRHFTQDEPIPGITYEYELLERFLPEITLEEVNSLAGAWVQDHNRVVLVSGPPKDGLAVPDERTLAKAIASAAASDLQPYVDTADAAPLLDSIPEPGAIAATKARKEFGITEWELSNGVRVVLRPTTFRADEVVFRATSPGGTSLASDDDYVPARTAARVVAAGGRGTFTATELRKALSGKVASVQPFIGDTDEGMFGSASRKDLETLFQLIYLTFTQPRADPASFSVLTAQMKSTLASQRSRPDFAFSETLQAALTQNHPRARPLSPELVGQMSLEQSFAFYKDRFADASDFTFVFVGSFDLPAIAPLVERYLATLPSIQRRETWRDVGITPPAGVVERRVSQGIEPKSRAGIVFTGPFEPDEVERVTLRALGQILQTRLREALREELGGTYTVASSAVATRVPREEYRISIDFGCSPDRTEELVKRVFAEIETLKSTGPTGRQVSDVREALLRDFETNSRQNSYLLSQISLSYQLSEDLGSFLRLPEHYRKLTPAAVQAAARTYLNTSNYVQVTLFPETTQEDPVLEERLLAVAR